MLTTPLLPFSRRERVTSRAELLLPALLGLLDGRGWRSARELAQWLGCDDRTIREAASLSEGAIISGQRGYALTRQASVEDAQHAADWLRSQARQMETRARQIESALHRRHA